MGLFQKIVSAARNAARLFESHWFDWTHHVQTHGNVSLEQAGISPERAIGSGRYVPGRAANIRAALRSISKIDLSQYTFVDLGSGKGRGLFIAAEFPFAQIVGVEFSEALHRVACRNVLTFRYRRRASPCIVPLSQDATSFVFPDGPLVLYMFNPFGSEAMRTVLANLAESLRRAPRHVIVILLWPVLGHMVIRISGMRLTVANARYHIYEAHPALTSAAYGHVPSANSHRVHQNP